MLHQCIPTYVYSEEGTEHCRSYIKTYETSGELWNTKPGSNFS
jgi:hypothetical protein